MRTFAQLFEKIDQTKSTKKKIHLIRDYFHHATPQDSAWVLYLLSGHKLKRLIGAPKIIEWCQKILSLPDWLISESYAAVGDAAETVALLLAPSRSSETAADFTLSQWIENKILPLYECDLVQKKRKDYQALERTR